MKNLMFTVQQCSLHHQSTRQSFWSSPPAFLRLTSRVLWKAPSGCCVDNC